MEKNKTIAHDDWREETLLRLNKSEVYKSLKKKCLTEPSGDSVLSLIDDAVFDAYHRSKLIIRHLGEFTLHDGEHLFRVLNLMDILLGKVVCKLSVPELMLLILTAFYHDIGMCPSEKEVLAWKKKWVDDEPNEFELEEFNKFSRFCEANSEKYDEYKNLVRNKNIKKSDFILDYLVSEYVRNTHADRSINIIDRELDFKIKYKNNDLKNEFAKLCSSHYNDPLLLLKLDKSRLCGQNTYICLPFIGVILRLADILDFDSKRTPEILYSHLMVRNPNSINEWKKHLSIEAWDIRPDFIGYQATCKHPAIESTIHQFCDIIDKELITCNNILSNLNDISRKSFPSYYKIDFPLKIDRSRIQTEKNVYGKPIYKYHNIFFSLNKQQVIELLMGTKLYGDERVALRELLQNSIDACLLRQAMELKWGNSYQPLINVELFEEGGYQYLVVEDNGIGMDENIIEKYYSKIGSSFYKSAEYYNIRSQYQVSFIPISRYGIGILSCFMISDTIEVNTRRVIGPHDSSSALNVIIEGHESIFWFKEGNRLQPGTTTKLCLRKKNPWEENSEDIIIKYVEDTIPNPPFKINIKTPNKKKVHSRYSFISKTISSLNQNWVEDEHIKYLEFKINSKKNGIIGLCKAGILEQLGIPKKELEILSRDIYVDDENYTLGLEMKMSNNSISKEFDSIEINEEGTVKNSNKYDVCSSYAKISMHGIEIPTNIFSNYYWDKNIPELNWPIPILLIIDISGTFELDLNSSRTSIILNSKWFKFEEILSRLVLKKIKQNVNKKYWIKLKDILISSTKSEIFKNVIAKI